MEQTWLERTHSYDIYRSITLQLDECSLYVTHGPHKGQEVFLTDNWLHVGRAEWCDISLPQDMRISRHHCKIQLCPEGLMVHDLGSSNGTFMGGSRVYQALLNPDQPMKVGDSVMELRMHSSPTEIRVNHYDKSGLLVGSSPAMGEIFSLLSRMSSLDMPVLLRGETGTGKTSVAQALHQQSPRSKGPMVHVNCGALSPSLIESELFGYERGAFTNASKRHRGFFEQAHQGTLFLDEIGELPLSLQPKLLDVLERKKIRRLGSETEIDVDFRLVTATHADLREAVEDGRFRQDLFYRLAVAELHVPPLRDRLEDIPLLAAHTLSQLSPHQLIQLTPGALRALKQHIWPGNIRELRNVLERSLMFSDENTLDSHHLQLHALAPGSTPVVEAAPPVFEVEPTTPDIHPPGQEGHLLLPASHTEDGTRRTMQERLGDIEKLILLETLEELNWNVNATRKALGLSRSWVYNLIKKHDLKPNEGEED